MGVTGCLMFEPFTIKGVQFGNRIVRSSMGGRSAYYDGTVNNAWKNFELRFARTGVAAIISATIDVDDKRLSPLEYPKISDERFVEPLRRGVRAVQALGCRYIMQLGDPGGHTQTSLLPQLADAKSASVWFDAYYGYRNRAVAMTTREVEEEVLKFGQAARRARAAGCDGIEVTASKGYIIHQFLNPATNRRKDRYGGSFEARFQLLKEVVQTVRKEVGRDFLFGVRLSAQDYNYLPVCRFQWPLVWPLRHYWMGNGLQENLRYSRWLQDLGVDFLHIDSGFGFINPKGNPGKYPLEGLRLFANSTRHLSTKAKLRAIGLNGLPAPIARALLGIGWRVKEAANADFAAAFKKVLRIPIIANGGFQRAEVIEHALASKCDMVAIARPLLANQDLLKHFRAGTEPRNPCTWCNKCCTRTAVLPLGCYERSRFDSDEQMEAQILEWSADPSP
jgi:2,4-dienoyl-CoA reductase-like NADH-dependent reductase (Old Yellow Enzyme family)